MTDNNIDVNIVPVRNGANRTCKEWCETSCGIILSLFTQGQKSHEFSNGLRVGNKE